MIESYSILLNFSFLIISEMEEDTKPIAPDQLQGVPLRKDIFGEYNY